MPSRTLSEADSERQLRFTGLPVFLVLLIVPGSCAFTHAKNIYVAQSEKGLANGQDCANSKSVAYFNNGANWVSTTPAGLQIGPGTTVHLCNVITSELTVRKSGTNGAPVTILFEPGAKISLPACSNADGNGCINLSNMGYIVLDGGADGVIEDTANGSSLANHTESVGILAKGTHDSQIQNLTIRNLYVHSSSSDDTDLRSNSGAMYLAGAVNNLLIQNNVMHDCAWCINYQFSSSASGVSIVNNEIFSTDHGIAIGGYGGGVVKNTAIFRNYIHDYFNWDVSSGGYHHDGIHLYTNAGALIDGVDIYDNTFGGDPGVSLTSHIYIERDSSDVNNVRVFNNLLLPGPSNRASNFGLIALGANSGTLVLNNTVICGTKAGGYGILIQGGNTIVQNNLITGCFAATAYYVPSAGVTLNHNTYADSENVGYLLYNATSFASIGAWRTASNQDGSSQRVSDAGVDKASGVLSSGSAAIGVGMNLSGLGIPRLPADKNGAARPSSAAWDNGAYQFGGANLPPRPPTLLRATVP